MQSRSRINLRRLPAGLLLGIAAAAHGATCSFTSLSGLSFGAYDTFSAAPLDGAATTQITCSSNSGNEFLTLTISLSAGTSGSYATRQMEDVFNNRLDYNVYVNAARTQIFGNGTAGTFAVTRNASLSKHDPPRVFTETFYGRVPAGQDARAGAYFDTLTLTITF